MSELSKIVKGLSPEQLERIHLRLSRKRAGTPRAQIRPRPEGLDSVPLSFGQQRYWFLTQLEPDGADYNVPTAVRMRGALDVAALGRCLEEVVRRHEVLRTVFRAADGRPSQVIAPAAGMPIKVVSLEGFSEAEREAEVWRLGTEEARRPFDLAAGPLLRAVLLRLGEREHVLLLTTHHIVCDRWSHGLFMRELAALYYAASTGAQAAGLPALPVQYADFACWQREQMQGETVERLLAYWRGRLEGAHTALDLPTDYPRTPAAGFTAARHEFTFDARLTAALKALGQREDATAFMILMAAFKAVLHRYAAQDELVVGFLSANRNRSEIENLIGQFANTLLMRTKLSGGQTFRELLAHVREETLGADAHQDLPFDRLVEELQPEREAGRAPLFEVAFNLQKAPLVDLDLPGLSLKPFEVYRGPANLDLYLEMEERGRELFGAWEYNAELFDAETVAGLAEAFRLTLERCAAAPETRLEELELPAGLVARAEAARARDRRQTVAVAATFTAEPVADSLAFWMSELGLPAAAEFAPYNQIFQQLLDPSSLFSNNAHGVNVVLVRFEDWLRHDGGAASAADAEGEARAKIERGVRELAAAVAGAAAKSATPHLVCVCPASPAFAAAAAEFHARTERLLASELEDAGGVYVVTSAELAASYPVPNYYDPHGDQLGHVPYTDAFYASLGTMLARKTYALGAAPFKVLVLDCDQTLWRGVVGEDGAEGVRVDAPRRALQEFAAAQHAAGVLVCLCSKNNEGEVFEVFARRADMVLRREHLAAWRINWLPKSENVRSLAEELGLGLDSFVFVDDDPVVCAEVEANCPGVLVLQAPSADGDDEGAPFWLERAWAFDRLKVTEEDRRRTDFYRGNASRERVRAEAATFEEFLAGLGLRVEVSALAPQHVARVAQLTERTNQFNATAVRRSEGEVRAALDAGEWLVVEVSDRFGDYGLVGFVVAEARGDSLRVEALALSCRVLGRGVEHHVMRALGGRAKARGLGRVEVRFKPTGRNQAVEQFLAGLGSGRRETAGDGFVFVFTAEEAAAASYSADAAPAATARVEGSARPRVAAPSAAARNARLRRIAASLSSPEQVLKAVEEQRRRARTDDGAVFVAPRTPVEEMLADIWRQSLGVDAVGAHDNFFKLGGHSLLATMLVSKVIDAFRVEVSLRDFLHAPTVAGMAEVIERRQIEAGDPEQLAELMAEMDALSDEEISALLASEGQFARDAQ